MRHRLLSFLQFNLHFKMINFSYNVHLVSTLSNEESTSWRVLSYTIQMYYVREYTLQVSLIIFKNLQLECIFSITIQIINTISC